MHAELFRLFAMHTSDDVAVTDGSHLVADLGIDSLGVMELIADLEDTFTLVIGDDALRDIDTISDVVQAIETRLVADGRLEG